MELHYACQYCGADSQDGYHWSGTLQVPICLECAQRIYQAFMEAAVTDAGQRAN